jgi:hypothetical protein
MRLEGMTAFFLQRTHAIAAILTLASTLRHSASQAGSVLRLPFYFGGSSQS